MNRQFAPRPQVHVSHRGVILSRPRTGARLLVPLATATISLVTKSIALLPLFFFPSGLRRSNFRDVDDRFGKFTWSFLRQIVPDAALDEAERVFASNLLPLT